MLTQFQSTFFQQEKRKVNRIGWVILFLSKAWIYIWTWISHDLPLSLTPNFTLNTYPKLTLISNFNVKCTLNPVLTLVIQSWILLKLVLLTLWSVPIDQAFTPIKKFEFFFRTIEATLSSSVCLNICCPWSSSSSTIAPL